MVRSIVTNMTQIQKGIHYPISPVNLSCENTRGSESIFSTAVAALASFFPIFLAEKDQVSAKQSEA